jgi:hypothetical protein
MCQAVHVSSDSQLLVGLRSMGCGTHGACGSSTFKDLHQILAGNHTTLGAFKRTFPQQSLQVTSDTKGLHVRLVRGRKVMLAVRIVLLACRCNADLVTQPQGLSACRMVACSSDCTVYTTVRW